MRILFYHNEDVLVNSSILEELTQILSIIESFCKDIGFSTILEVHLHTEIRDGNGSRSVPKYETIGLHAMEIMKTHHITVTANKYAKTMTMENIVTAKPP